MPFHLHTSNRTENLLREFVSRTRDIDPMKERFVITSGKGMRTWIKRGVAELRGVSANLRFVSPERVIWDLANPENGNGFGKPANPFSKERMAWKIRHALPKLAKEFPGPFKIVSSFLEEDDPLKKIQLCWEIASVFDGYLHYRPSLIENWKEKKLVTGSFDEEWQSMLWNKIVEHMPRPTLRSLIRDSSFASDGPDTLWFFGLSPIPPVHLQALAEYARKKDFHAFLLQPTHEYWSEVRSNRERILLAAQAESQDNGEDDFLELGPPLLGALGKAWQKFILQLEDYNVYDPDFISSDIADDNGSALRSLQSHLLEMPECKEVEKIPFREDDRSIQFHSCHGPQREVQVLQDFLLDQFNQDSDLKPNEILVLCPNLQKYSALLKAAFDNPETPDRRIPYGLCDREWRSESRVMDTFYHILEFADGRATARDFFTLISRPVICEKFELNDNDLEILRWWIEQTRIAWGFNPGHKEEMDLPGFPENTWEQGLDRMMLGFCSASTECEGFDDLLPFDEVEGSRVVLLSKLSTIVDLLRAMHEQCAQKHPPAKWRSIIEDSCLDKFFIDDSKTHADLVELRKSLELLTNETSADADVEPLGVIRLHLDRTLNDKSLYSRHLTHGVTFASPRSARGIPAKIICLIGLNGGSFPSPSTRPSFDLCKLKPEYGDRNQAEEDRLLVMEAILCARDCLYFSFRGQSNKNNDEVPPSVVIEETLEQLDELMDFSGFKAGGSAKEAFFFKHPLQPFGKKYFREDPSLKTPARFLSAKGPGSFSIRNCEAAKALDKPREDLPAFCPEPIVRTQPFSQLETISMENLVSFWKGPSAYFLKSGLMVSTWEQESLLPENERLDACARKDSLIKTRMIARSINSVGEQVSVESVGLSNEIAASEEKEITGIIDFWSMDNYPGGPYEFLQRELQKKQEADPLFGNLYKGSQLPPGSLGLALNSSLNGEIEVILQRTPFDFDQVRPGQFVTGKIGDFQVEGESSLLFGNSLALFHGSKLKGKQCMEGLVRHLWENAFGPLAGTVETSVCAVDQTLVLKPQASSDCCEQMQTLLGLFEEGMTRPLPFFPNSSLTWLAQTHKQKNKKPRYNAKTPENLAQDKWNDDRGGEGNEFANKLCFPKDPWEDTETIELNKLLMGFMDELGTFLK